MLLISCFYILKKVFPLILRVWCIMLNDMLCIRKMAKKKKPYINYVKNLTYSWEHFLMLNILIRIQESQQYCENKYCGFSMKNKCGFPTFLKSRACIIFKHQYSI